MIAVPPSATSGPGDERPGETLVEEPPCRERDDERRQVHRPCGGACVGGLQIGYFGSAEVTPLAVHPYVAVVRADDPLVELAEIPLAELATREWVANDLRAGPCRQVLPPACAQALHPKLRGTAPRSCLRRRVRHLGKSIPPGCGN